MNVKNLGRIVVFALVATVVLAAAGCSAPSGAGSGSSGGGGGPAPMQVKLTDADNGKSTEVARGALVVVTLEGNPSTGYSWSTDGTLPPQLQQKGAASFESSKPGIPGAGGAVKLEYKAVQTGSGDLKLKYWRPFEKTTPPVKTWSATVVVK